ncbi:MAG: tetratricopeptide repeat protein [Proteobacteria bacterium]|nr:tetratricopeptide repeat protein [Pseudomonadota bacterium]TDJ35144.1 MAG: tetratricopeptide repeat protein [Gammaproteobacteria bacterium]
MAFAGFVYLIQIGLIVHVLRSGRNMYWVFILLIAPGIGGLAYFIVELLPDLMNNRRARSAVRGITRTLNPGADLRQRQREHKLSGSIDAVRHLAGELVESGRNVEAIEHYESVLSGLYEHDPNLMLGLASAQFGNEQYEDARKTLDLLIKKNPDFKSPDGHLLYAQAIEACGDDEKALAEYKAVVVYYAGAEARLRYGLMLEKLCSEVAALAEFEEIIAAADLAPRHYRKTQREWISEAKDGIKRLAK